MINPFREYAILWSTWRALWPHLRLPRWLIVVSVLLSILGSLLDGVAFGLAAVLIDVLRPGSPAPAPTGSGFMGMALAALQRISSGTPLNTLVLVVIGVIASLILKNALLYWAWIAGARVRRHLVCQVRQLLFERLLATDLSFFEEHKTGELSEVFHVETNRIIISMDNLLILLQRIAMVAVYFVLIIVLSPLLAMGVVVIGALVGGLMGMVSARLRRYGDEATRRNQALAGRLSESFGGIRTIRATHAEAQEAERFYRFNSALGGVEEGASRVAGAGTPIGEIVGVSGGMLLLLGSYVWLIQPGHIAPITLVMFAGFLLRLMPALAQVNGLFAHLVYLAGGMREIIQWLQLPRFPRTPFGTRTLTTLGLGVQFHDVTLDFANGTRALDGFNLFIPAGKTVALVGGSGAGKTTAAGLLLRLREPSSGRITVDGVDAHEFTPESWHRTIASVEQDPFVFHDTVAYNVAFGIPDASPERIREALRRAHLEAVIDSKPGGLDAIVGERGSGLSGGQRQRLAIARALIREPRLLVLDEATSSLDNESERQVQRDIEEVMQGRTALIIAHRLSSIRQADWIVVMDHGRKVEEGTWEDLVKNGGRFAALLAAAHGDELTS